MPAHMVEMRDTCHEPRCLRTATHIVRNTYNEVMGRYCEPHAKKKVERLNRLG